MPLEELVRAFRIGLCTEHRRPMSFGYRQTDLREDLLPCLEERGLGVENQSVEIEHQCPDQGARLLARRPGRSFREPITALTPERLPQEGWALSAALTTATSGRSSDPHSP